MFKYIIVIIYEVPTPGRVGKKMVPKTKSRAEKKESCRKQKVVPKKNQSCRKKNVVPKKKSRAEKKSRAREN